MVCRKYLLLLVLFLFCNTAFQGILNARTVTVAASNSSDPDKAAADVVCTGVHDELTIQKVLDGFDGNDSESIKVVFCDGVYNMDGFHLYPDATHRTALKIPEIAYLEFGGRGNLRARAGISVDFRVSPSAYEGLDPGEQLCVMLFSDNIGRNKNDARLRNFLITLPDVKHKVICINLFRCFGAILENLSLTAVGTGPGVIPVEGSVGIRGQNVNTNGIGQFWKDIVAKGFYEAFQMGGEHTICMGLLAYQSYYGYTFGNYERAEWGVWEHPITLINCSEELCCSLPLFNQCGEARDPNNAGRQCVDMISHTMEFRDNENGTLAPVLPAREVVPGSWCGNITFAVNTKSLSKENVVDVQYWEKGSGHRFKTRNSAHALGGTTAERLSYVPTYVQTYFDTDLNKMVVFNGEQWVDYNGNKVD